MIESLLKASFVLLILSLYRTSLLKGSNSGFSCVLLIPANTGNEIFTCLGNNFPASILVAMSNCVNPVLERSFIFCSMLPKPEVLLLIETATVPRSAKTKSMRPSAAQALRSSKSESLNSFTQTSASIAEVEFVFSTAIKIPRTSPKFGLPNTIYF